MDTDLITDAVGSHENREESPSHARTESHTKIADNMTDFPNIDFNSADDVRQAMKAKSGTMVSNYNEDDSNVIQNKPVLNNPLNSKGQETRPAPKPGKARPRRKTRKIKRIGIRRGRRKPNQKTRLARVDAMYIGKLSNVVHFKHNRYYGVGSGSESDVDSVLFSSS